jgi:CRP-like cAMP-binding protein
MKLVSVPIADLVVSDELNRTGSSKQFVERLKSSIEQVGLAEPIKVTLLPSGKYLVVDGVLRLQAIREINRLNGTAFETVAAYVTDYDRRYEIRFQTDIYQDLLPSQLAVLVEHLHKSQNVSKGDIARYIGVSPATLRNYTGLWRLLQREGLFARIVELMDVGVLPASNPYAWLRLTKHGIRSILESSFAADSESAEEWIDQRVLEAGQSSPLRFTTKFVEAATDDLPPECYREGQDLRLVKKDLGLRRASSSKIATSITPAAALSGTRHHLTEVSGKSPDVVLQVAARSLLMSLT